MRKIDWPDLKFPPINLWSYPMNYTIKSRYRDMYCSEELENYIHYHSIVDLQKLQQAQKEFEYIWQERHQYWEQVNTK